MTNLKHEGLKTMWFGTNTSPKRVQQLRKDKRACVYYVDGKLFKGLMLVGTVDISQDMESKKMLWTEGAEVYWPLGVEDPDYSVLYFTAKRGNYYPALWDSRCTEANTSNKNGLTHALRKKALPG